MTAIAELAAEALADDKKSTPGPWDRVDEIVCADDGNSIAECFAAGGPRMTNAACIAAARTREPILAAWVAKVAPLIETLRVEHHRLTDDVAAWILAVECLLDATTEPK